MVASMVTEVSFRSLTPLWKVIRPLDSEAVYTVRLPRHSFLISGSCAGVSATSGCGW